MIDVEYLGQRLLQKGFRAFFLYLFRCIEGRSFIVEPLHEELFKYFQNIYDGKITRCNINICPRSAKTTMSEYFNVWVLTNNPKSQVIYTSYSQPLLSEISSKVASILENPIYKAMYPNRQTELTTSEVNPVDDFWRDYIFEKTNKSTYSSKLIKTAEGGSCLFASCGSSILGWGCGVRNSKNFSGMLIMDDINKSSEITSEVFRNRVVRYYEETLLSRLNNPDTPIINIQQRLHVQDLSGVLEEKYNFKTLRIPLLDKKGKCRLPSQYTAKRLQELQKNPYMWSAQFMQNPYPPCGNMIKSYWFKYYTTLPELNKVFMTADTAQKTKENNDFSVMACWGYGLDCNLYLIDLIRGKWEAPDLLKNAKAFIAKYQIFNNKRLYNILIEDKSSGTGLIQQLRREIPVAIKPIQVNKDKVTRVDDCLPFIETGRVYLPFDENYSFNKDFIKECELFSRDMSHAHDDMVDNLTQAIQSLTETILPGEWL